MLTMSARHIEIVRMHDESRTDTGHNSGPVEGAIGKPDLPYRVSGKPQSVEGARKNTPPTAFRFESSTVNTGEPARDEKESGK